MIATFHPPLFGTWVSGKEVRGRVLAMRVIMDGEVEKTLFLVTHSGRSQWLGMDEVNLSGMDVS